MVFAWSAGLAAPRLEAAKPSLLSHRDRWRHGSRILGRYRGAYDDGHRALDRIVGTSDSGYCVGPNY